MEDETRKGNTDCVYFLASPLTCKKGSECEFRHSESARLNPRDCYYWVNASCLNPCCSFRHPPLGGLTDSSQPVHQPWYASTVPTSKSNVPCYFYFNAYCIKGDECPFLHDTLPAHKPLKAPLETVTVHPPEKKASTGSDTGPASVEVPANHSGSISEPIKQEHFKKAPQKRTSDVALEELSPSVESSVPECEEPAIKLSHEYSSLSLDQGSDEFVKECVEPDEWWESSPGFDVLVDDVTEQLPYDEDGDCMLGRERKSEIIQMHLLQYDYEVPAGFDPMGYPDNGSMYDSYNPAENRYTPEYFEKENSGERRQTRERCLETVPHRKRKSSRRRCEVVDERASVDLRDQLRKWRRMDGGSHKRHTSRARYSSRERYVRRGMGPFLHGRLASEVGSMNVSADTVTNFALNNFHRRGWPGFPESSRWHVRSRLRERESRSRKPRKERLVSGTSVVSQGLSSWRAKSYQVKTAAAATFSGPKTLAQIKEEKRRATAAEGNMSVNYLSRQSTKRVDRDFEGPKPLNELLKDKKRSGPPNGNTDTFSLAKKQEHPEFPGSWREDRLNGVHSGGDNENQSTGYVSDYFDDDDDDDDALRRKLADILAS